MTGVGEDRTILHQREVLGAEDITIAGDGDEDVADLRCLMHRHDAVTLHHRIERLGWIDLSDDDIGAESTTTFRDSLSAIPETGDDEDLSCEQDVGRTEYRIKGRLSGAVTIVEHVLGIGVIDSDHWEGEGTIFRHLS